MSQTPFRYIRRPELLSLLSGISRSKLEQMVTDGDIPQPYRLGARTVAWRSDELERALTAFSRVSASVYGPAVNRTR